MDCDTLVEENSNCISKTLWSYVQKALNRLYKDDMHLINNTPYYHCVNGNHHVGERSIVFRFAHYLLELLEKDKEFSDYQLDCEYNRNGINRKTLPSFPNGVYPDIILHRRGNNDNNILVMEFKTYWNSDISGDIEKLKELTAPDKGYKFALGLSIVITKTRSKVMITPVVNGKAETAVSGVRASFPL